MGKIKKQIEIVGLRKSKKLEALFDSGADVNYVRKEFSDGDSIDNLGFIRYHQYIPIKMGDSRFKRGEIIAFPKLVIDENSIEKLDMTVLASMPHDVVIGHYLMQRLGIILNMKEEKIEYGRSV